MPRLGNLDLAKFAVPAPLIDGYRTEPLTLKQVQILEVHMEIDDEAAAALLPRAMYPAIPAYAIFNLAHYHESPWGSFSIAEVRVAGRTGVRPRGFVLRSYIDNPQAAEQLTARWGFATAPGKVKLRLRHDRVSGMVKLDDTIVLELEEIDRDSISGGDIQYIASMHLARNREDGKLILVQCDPEFVFSRAERGRPRIVTLDNAAFNAGEALRLTNSISACFATADVTLPKIRYICDPELPALRGTTKVAA